MTGHQLVVLEDADRLAEVAARRVAHTATEAIAERGRFVLALSGGSTPRRLYHHLAQRWTDSAIDWDCVQFFWGDERCVPPEHPDSNYRMARQNLLEGLGVSEGQIHRIKGELPPREGASAYRAELARILGPRGRFDLILLGLGTDGHTASLFPGTEGLEERQLRAVADYIDKLGAWRITLTLPVINDARAVVFLVTGPAKAEVLADIWRGADLPAGRVRPSHGTLTWLVDVDAAMLLPSEAAASRLQGADGPGVTES